MQIPREENAEADALANLASTTKVKNEEEAQKMRDEKEKERAV